MANYDPGYLHGEVYFEEGRKPGTYTEAWGEEDPGVKPYIALPHQCSDWKIGTVDQARLLIADLEALIEELRNR